MMTVRRQHVNATLVLAGDPVPFSTAHLRVVAFDLTVAAQLGIPTAFLRSAAAAAEVNSSCCVGHCLYLKHIRGGLGEGMAWPPPAHDLLAYDSQSVFPPPLKLSLVVLCVCAPANR